MSKRGDLAAGRRESDAAGPRERAELIVGLRDRRGYVLKVEMVCPSAAKRPAMVESTVA